MISGINGYSSNTNMLNKSVSKSNVENSKNFTTNTQYEFQGNSILSTIHLETGESIGIYYDEISTDSNPVMLAKIIGSDGSANEIKVDINKIDINNASYVEMIALSSHLKQTGKIDGHAGAFAAMVFNSRVKEANNNNIYTKENFVPAMKELVSNALKDGQMDTYLRYLKELDIYLGRNKV